MQGPTTCSVGQAMDILGERWTFLILRESFYGVRRFSDMQRNLGIARNILSARLQTLVGAGILETRRYQEEPERFEYRLTARRAATSIPRSSRSCAGATSTSTTTRRRSSCTTRCGALAEPKLVCGHCGKPMHPHDVTPVAASR